LQYSRPTFLYIYDVFDERAMFCLRSLCSILILALTRSKGDFVNLPQV